MIRPVFDLGLSVIAGAALAAPLILPGLQLAKGSNRNVVGPALAPKGLPPHELLHFIFQGFDGLPLLHSEWFGVSVYEWTCAYVGVTVLVLAATALVSALEATGGALHCFGGGSNGTACVRAPPRVDLGQLGCTYLLDFRSDPRGSRCCRSLGHWDGRLGQVPQRAARSTCARYRIRGDGGFAWDHLACGPTRTYTIAGKHPLSQLYLAHRRGDCRVGSGVDPRETGHSDSERHGFIALVPGVWPGPCSCLL